MPTDQKDIIQQSLAKFARDKLFLDRFYELLFARSGTAQSSFQKVDMEAQKRKLGAALPRFLALASEDPASQAILAARARHAQNHRSQRSLDYSAWIETLCLACRQHDSQFTASMVSSLRDRLQIAVSHLRGDNE